MNIPQHNYPQVTQHNSGSSMTPPQQQSNQNSILAPPPILQGFAGTPVPPLDRTRFQDSYRHFCLTKKVVINDAALNIGGKQVDLHTLHEEVFKLCATGRVSFVPINYCTPQTKVCMSESMWQITPDFWHLIGSKLGFFGEELASNEVAIQVATIYRQFLHRFDTIYVASFQGDNDIA